MRCGEMQAEKERLLRLGKGFDGLDRPVAKQFSHVTVTLDRDLALMELTCLRTTLCCIGAVIEIVGCAGIDAEELVVAALDWAEIRQKAEMPFANKARAVARLLEQRGKRRMAGRRTDAFRRRGVDWLFEAHLEPHLIAPGNQPGASR